MGKHLVVLIHGLWGNYKHMDTLKEVFEKTLKNKEDDSEENNFIFFTPTENARFKTLDGIELLGYRTLIEISQFIEAKREIDVKISKISVLGYSLGGLIARFVIGKMFTDCIEIYKNIEPIIFITLATPHVGVNFYNPNKTALQSVLYSTLTLLGSNILGKSGSELFIKNSGNDIILRLSTGDFIENLKKFKYRIVVANVKNDRTVAFYTSFISHCDPFIQTGNNILYKFEKDIPNEHSYTEGIPNIVEMNELDPMMKLPHYGESKPIPIRRLLFFGFAIIIFLPVALILNIIASIYRSFATRKYRRYINKGIASKFVRNKLGLGDIIRGYMEDAYDNLVVRGNDYSDVKEPLNNESTINSAIFSESDNEKIIWKNLIDKYSENWKSYNQNSYNEKFDHLPFDKNRIEIVNNLNALEWIKLPIYIRALNAHRSIAARNGISNEVPNSVGTVQFIGELVNYLTNI